MLNRMKTLIAQLLKANAAYYGKDDPIMTDLEYDRLYSELEQLEQETGIVLASSPTQRVSGEVLESLTAVAHTKPMLSADKTKSTSEIFKFIGGQKVVISWKLDGLTLVLRYEGGKLAKAITRGDGLKGEDVTHTVRVMGNVPLTIPCTEPVEVRGEGVISWQNFQELNETLGGTSAKRLAYYGKSRPDGKSLSRVVKLTTAEKSDYFLTADSGPGEENKTGLIVPRFGKSPEQHVSVVLTWRQLNELLFTTAAHYKAWLSARYMADWTAIHAPRFEEGGQRKGQKRQEAASEASPARQPGPPPAAPPPAPAAAPTQAPGFGSAFGSVYGSTGGSGQADDRRMF